MLSHPRCLPCLLLVWPWALHTPGWLSTPTPFLRSSGRRQSVLDADLALWIPRQRNRYILIGVTNFPEKWFPFKVGKGEEAATPSGSSRGLCCRHQGRSPAEPPQSIPVNGTVTVNSLDKPGRQLIYPVVGTFHYIRLLLFFQPPGIWSEEEREASVGPHRLALHSHGNGSYAGQAPSCPR